MKNNHLGRKKRREWFLHLGSGCCLVVFVVLEGSCCDVAVKKSNIGPSCKQEETHKKLLREMTKRPMGGKIKIPMASPKMGRAF